MYRVLNEQQAREIRKCGLSVVEWKWCICNNVNVAAYVINKLAKTTAQGWKEVLDNVTDFVGMAAFAIKEICKDFINSVYGYGR